MTNANYCPSCGFNLAADREVVIGRWVIDPVNGATFEGQSIGHLPATKRAILHSIAAAGGRIVSFETLINRCLPMDGTNLAAHISQMRGIMRKAGAPTPIQAVRGLGYRWNDSEGAE